MSDGSESMSSMGGAWRKGSGERRLAHEKDENDTSRSGSIQSLDRRAKGSVQGENTRIWNKKETKHT